MNNKWQDFYYELAHWEVKYHENYDRAFELFELSKSRSLFDQMYENQQAELFSPDDPESVHILSLQKRIDQWYEQINGESSLSTNNGDILKISELELEYQISLDAYMNSNSDLTDLRYPTVTTLEEVQSLLNNETAYLSYGVRKNSLFIFLISKEDNVFKEVVLRDDAQKVLSSEVNNFRNAIINLEDSESITSLSNQLIDQIFSPIINHLDGIKHLIISPDGPLHLLSFEALVIQDQYLIEKFSTKYLPSFSIYTSIKYPKVKEFEYELLAIAGSGFESGDKNVIHGSQKSYATLPFSLAEVDSIHNYFEISTILKNEEVTEYAFKNLNLSDYRYIHLATHGELDEFFPNQSGLILSNKRNSESIFGEDGFLTAREIAQLDLSADLITLSACNTGAGKVITGEGVMGLQRAVLAAGASSVIVSLWNIYDRSTPIFMNKFYRQMHEFEDKETSVIDRFKMYIDYYEPELIDYKTLALQQTKIEMIHHPFYNQPVHWAPFILIGK
jgi:CHAT domain-containing protein